ncbi:UbiA prenyltransferase [Roridomyces roridus]|uniref:UbiA prenyltransferase n=1 Tax=Roridomyces roridus TaxID=1738132 RepID=A0AAD7FMS8_9AGAR|nr:UbiA prenyltransferase [Roridomyces roridus]
MLSTPLRLIHHELIIFWRFTWRDWSAGIMPGTLRTIAALCSLHSPSAELIVLTIARAFVYFVLYLYTFNIANQITGLDEDRINKPDRPLPSGLLSIRGAYVRLCLLTAVYIYVSAVWGVLPWTFLWLFISALETFGQCDRNWFFKNVIFVSVGTFCLLQAAWALAAPITPRETHWAMVLSLAFGITINIQDLRDVEGDRATFRRTLPIVLGVRNFRWVMAAITAITPYVCWLVEFELDWRAGVALTIAMFLLAGRILGGASKDKKYDHKTYMVRVSRLVLARKLTSCLDADLYPVWLHCCTVDKALGGFGCDLGQRL